MEGYLSSFIQEYFYRELKPLRPSPFRSHSAQPSFVSYWRRSQNLILCLRRPCVTSTSSRGGPASFQVGRNLEQKVMRKLIV
ncbi:hypothetical protein K1719_002120 [Acacia pycnantha]|nr:hypothetical protein K1719_002120 [Acacia pycnantha]